MTLLPPVMTAIFPSSLPVCLALRFICSEFRLLCYEASVDDERGTNREFRVVGREIENRRRDVLGGAYSPCRGNRTEGIAHLAFLSSKAIKHVSRDDPRGDGVDADISSGEFERDRFGQAFDSMLGSNVNADLSQANVPRHAGIVDDGAAPVLEHGRNFVTHRIENAPHVDVKNAPIFGFGSLIERAFPFNSGVVKRD